MHAFNVRLHYQFDYHYSQQNKLQSNECVQYGKETELENNFLIGKDKNKSENGEEKIRDRIFVLLFKKVKIIYFKPSLYPVYLVINI